MNEFSWWRVFLESCCLPQSSVGCLESRISWCEAFCFRPRFLSMVGIVSYFVPDFFAKCDVFPKILAVWVKPMTPLTRKIGMLISEDVLKILFWVLVSECMIFLVKVVILLNSKS